MSDLFNKPNNKMITNAISAVLALGIAGTCTLATAAMPNGNGVEKCYGVAKAGRNDCSTSAHGCAGETKTDRAKDEYVMTPTGLCDKLAGGSTKA